MRRSLPYGRTLPVTVEDCIAFGAETISAPAWALFCYRWIKCQKPDEPDWDIRVKLARSGTVYVTLGRKVDTHVFKSHFVAKVRFADHPYPRHESRADFFLDASQLKVWEAISQTKKAYKKWLQQQSHALESRRI